MVSSHDSAWWVSTIIVGIVIGVVSNALYKVIESRMRTWSAWTKDVAQQLHTDRERLQRLLEQDETAQILRAIQGLRDELSSWVMLGLGLAVLWEVASDVASSENSLGSMRMIVGIVLGLLSLSLSAFLSIRSTKTVVEIQRQLRSKALAVGCRRI